MRDEEEVEEEEVSGILNDLFLTFMTSVNNWQWTK
jgi:hypothetical protein